MPLLNEVSLVIVIPSVCIILITAYKNAPGSFDIFTIYIISSTPQIMGLNSLLFSIDQRIIHYLLQDDSDVLSTDDVEHFGQKPFI